MLGSLQTNAGFHFPDYQGGSIVNLLSSIIHALGGVSPHPRLKALDTRLLHGRFPDRLPGPRRRGSTIN